MTASEPVSRKSRSPNNMAGTVASSSSNPGPLVVGRHASTALGGPLYGQTGFVYEVAFAPHGKSLVSASLDKTIRRWSASLQLQ